MCIYIYTYIYIYVYVYVFVLSYVPHIHICIHLLHIHGSNFIRPVDIVAASASGLVDAKDRDFV